MHPDSSFVPSGARLPILREDAPFCLLPLFASSFFISYVLADMCVWGVGGGHKGEYLDIFALNVNTSLKCVIASASCVRASA